MPRVRPVTRSVLARQKAEMQRRKEEEERAKEVLQEFVATFEQPENKIGKTFVRGGVVNPAENDNNTNDSPSSTNVYQPNSLAANKMAELEMARKAAEAKARKFMEEAAKNRPKKPINEEEIRCLFGKYGPLASVKIMWPRNGDERVKSCLTGFVAYMTRKDAERAVSGLKGYLLHGYELKLSWGKPVVIPHYPVYVPKAMLDLIAPPPASGLPFNAQPDPVDREEYKWPLPEKNAPLPEDPEQREAWLKMIRNAVVKVVIPTERRLAVFTLGAKLQTVIF
ncbi:hypothetical protein D918_03840 [Trichuris suis]|nr:hypothetical protein D918_03840 [Trichuris suis]